MRYVITDSQLILDGFLFKPKYLPPLTPPYKLPNIEDLPEINGTKPIKLSRESGLLDIGFKNEYKNLNKKIPFNGSFWVGKDFMDSQYVHMGFQSPTAYKTVLKFDFEDGIIVNVEDKSKQVEKAREKGASKGSRPESMAPKDLGDWIMKRFSLGPPSGPPKQTTTVKSQKEEMLDELDRLKKL